MKLSIKKIIVCAVAAVIFALTPLVGTYAKEWSDQYNEWTYSVTYDFNGGATYDGKGTLVLSGLVAVAPALNDAYLIRCIDSTINDEEVECHGADVKKGKELAYVTVNGERHDLGEGDGYMLNDDTTIVYYWNDTDLEPYAADDENGHDVSVAFDEEEDHVFRFFVNQYSFTMTDEQLEEEGIPREEYEAGKAAIGAAVEKFGAIISYFEFEIYDEDDHPITEGPFEIKIKFTDDMTGYDTYQLVYVDMDDQGNVTVGDSITLTLKDGYLVGTVPHFSGYVLVGADEDTAKSPDASVVSNNGFVTSTCLSFTSCVAIAVIACGIIVRKRLLSTK